MKAPKYMNSRFDSTCSNCGGHIAQGSRIHYFGRGKVHCSACMQPEPNASQGANAAASPADAWASVLAWDNSTPEPGASVGVKPARGAVVTAIRPDNRDECDHCGKLDELSHNDHADAALCTDCDNRVNTEAAEAEAVAADIAEADKLADVGAQIIAQAQVKAKAFKAEAAEPAEVFEPFEFSDSERAEALTSELLIILVNAIDVAGISGRHTLATYCREQSKRSLSMSSRQHIWQGIAQAIDRC